MVCVSEKRLPAESSTHLCRTLAGTVEERLMAPQLRYAMRSTSKRLQLEVFWFTVDSDLCALHAAYGRAYSEICGCWQQVSLGLQTADILDRRCSMPSAVRFHRPAWATSSVRCLAHSRSSSLQRAGCSKGTRRVPRTKLQACNWCSSLAASEPPRPAILAAQRLTQPTVRMSRRLPQSPASNGPQQSAPFNLQTQVSFIKPLQQWQA